MLGFNDVLNLKLSRNNSINSTPNNMTFTAYTDFTHKIINTSGLTYSETLGVEWVGGKSVIWGLADGRIMFSPYTTGGSITRPLALFTVAQPAQKGLTIKAAASQTANLTEWQDSTGAPLSVVDKSGNVGIGTTSPLFKLDVVGDVNATGCVRAGGSVLGGVCSSDERLKSEIQSFDLGLRALLGINPKVFKYNGLGEHPKSNKPELGVIAQEVEKTAPELIFSKAVKLNKNDQKVTLIKQVNYSSFIYVLINAVKDLYAMYLNHEKSLDDQDTQISEIKAMLNKIKTQNEMLLNENRLIKEKLNKLERAE